MATGIIKKALIGMVVLLLLGLVCFFLGRRMARDRDSFPQEERVDTLYVFDTIVEYKPILKEITKIEKVFIPVHVTDTMWVHDTLYIQMERESQVWEDSLSRIHVSGIFPQVDSVVHYIQERVVTREVSVPQIKKTQWGIGVHAGYGVQFGDRLQFYPYVGIGVSYNILSW